MPSIFDELTEMNKAVIMSDEKINCTKKDFFPALAIEMASNKSVMFRIKPFVYDITYDELSKSMLYGLLPDEQLLNYKYAYTFLCQTMTDETCKTLFDTLFPQEFPTLFEEANNVIENMSDEHIYIEDIACSSTIKARTVQSYDIQTLSKIFCILGYLVYKDFPLYYQKDFVDNQFRNVLFGNYLTLFYRDCDIDQCFSQFFTVKNSVLLRKILIRNFMNGEEEYQERLNKDEKALSYDFVYKLNDILYQTAANCCLNAFPFDDMDIVPLSKLQIPDVKGYRYYHIDDKLLLSDYEATILNYISYCFDFFADNIINLQNALIAQAWNETDPLFKKMEHEDKQNLLNNVSDISDADDIQQNQRQELLRIKEKNQQLKLLIDKRDEKTSEMEKNIKSQEMQIADLQRKNMELEELLYQTVCGTDSISKNDAISVADERLLYESSGVIIGGHQHLMNKLLQCFPKWVAIDTNSNVKNNWNAVKKADYIVMQTDYMSHSIYNMAISAIQDKSKVVFMQNNNVELIKKQVLQKIKQQSL